MATMQRHKTRYPGVFYIKGKAVGSGKTEKIYYIMYRKDGKLIEEKAGRQFVDDMTPGRAAGVRAQRIEGRQKSNAEKRKSKKGRVTIQVLADKYFSQKTLSESVKTDMGRYKNYLKDSFGHKQPAEIAKLSTDRLRINLLKKRSPQLTKHVLALLKRLINFGTDRGLCKGINFKITMPEVDNVKTEDLTTDQLQSLFRTWEETPYQTAAQMMRLALYSGMRRGEIFKLKWSDIDLEKRFIHIRNPKGGKSQKIPINSNTRALLNNISRNDQEYIFPARNGGPRKSISRDVREIKIAAGLPADFRPFHGLRHVYASMLASSGRVDMFTLQRLLTHKSPQMTQRYAHLRDGALRRASDTVDDILFEAMQEDTIKAVK